MEWTFIAGALAIFVMAVITIAAVKSRWNHRKIIKQAKLDAIVEAEREAALDKAREKISKEVPAAVKNVAETASPV